jgi:hypothetical protein
MKEHNPLAAAMNRDLEAGAPQLLAMLSERGKAIYFPHKGILGQTAEAKGVSINATIGTAFENDGSPLTLECMEALVNVPSESFLYAPASGCRSCGRSGAGCSRPRTRGSGASGSASRWLPRR